MKNFGWNDYRKMNITLKQLVLESIKEINSDSQFMLPISLIEKHGGSTISTRIIKATEFFKNKLNIDKTPVKVNVISLTKDDGEIRYDFNINSHVINISSNVNEDRQIRALAHELTHLQQIVSGRLDYNNRKWLGKSYVGVDYKIQPWESEARTSAAELWVEFNRSVRDGKIKL